MELGQTKDVIRSQHGAAAEENHSKNTAVYRSGPWKVDIEFCGDVACRVTFTRLGQLSEDEIQSTLTQNAAGATWHELETPGPKRSWQRSDFAAAECERLKPRSITFVQAPPQPEPSPTLALAETQSWPVPYAVERPKPAAERARSSDGMLANVLSFLSSHILVVLFPALILLIALLTKLSRRTPTPAPTAPRRVVSPRQNEKAKSPEGGVATLESLESDKFELLVGEIFRRRGYAVEISGGLGADGGKDLTLRKAGETVLVQCKHWSEWKVSQPSLREFFGNVIEEGASSGIFVTSGSYTRDARAFAEGKPIRLLGRAELEELVREVSEPNENLYDFIRWIDRFVSVAHVVDPCCPFCHGAMKLKRSVQGKPFWSCRTFPKCCGKRAGRIELLGLRPAEA
jgi:HJR/Mrr/RecB family endonuclease